MRGDLPPEHLQPKRVNHELSLDICLANQGIPSGRFWVKARNLRALSAHERQVVAVCLELSVSVCQLLEFWPSPALCVALMALIIVKSAVRNPRPLRGHRQAAPPA